MRVRCVFLFFCPDVYGQIECNERQFCLNDSNTRFQITFELVLNNAYIIPPNDDFPSNIANFKKKSSSQFRV